MKMTLSKKLLSILLAILVLISCFSVTVSAEETATPDYSAEEAILAEKMNYPEFELTKLGEIGEYGFFYDLSDIAEPWEPVVYIGDYKFIAANAKFVGNPGLYLVSADKAYTLEEAYYSDIVTDMDAVYEMIKSNDINYAFTVENVDSTLLDLFEAKGFSHLLFVHNLGEINGKQLCFTAGGVATMVVTNFVIGDAVYCSSDGDLGLYIVKDEEIYPLDNAYDEGIINSEEADEIYKILAKPENKMYTNGVYKFDSEAEQILQSRFGSEYDFSLLYLCDIGEYKIYSDYRENIVNTNKSKEFGLYSISYYDLGEPYGLGVYAIKDNEAYTLEEAYENRIIPNIKSIYEATRKGGNYILYTFHVKETVDQYFKDNGINVDFANHLGDVNDFALYYAGSNEYTNAVYEVAVGDYRFYSLGQLSPYDIGLFVGDSSGIYKLGSAYDSGIINDGDMDAIYAVIRNEENREKDFLWDVVKQGEAAAEEQLFIQYLKDNNKYLYGPDENGYKFRKIGEYKGYSLCYGYSHLEPMEWTFILGEYRIYVNTCCESLFFINDTEVMPVSEARDNGFIDDVDEFIYILSYLTYDSYFDIVSKSVVTTDGFSTAVNDYLSQLGLENDYPQLTTDDVYTSDWLTVYREEENWVMFGIKGKTQTPTKEYLREYTFNSDTFFHESNPCGYCYYSKTTGVVALQNLKSGKQEKFAKYAPGTKTNDTENNYYVLKTYLESTNALTEYNDTFYFEDFGKTGEYSLCYGSGNLLYSKPTTVKIGEYDFTVQKLEMFSDNPLNLYLIKDAQVLPFDESAYESGIITNDDVKTAIQLITTANSTLTNDWTIRDATGQEFPPVDDNPVTDIIIAKTTFKAGEQTKLLENEVTEEATFASDNEAVATIDENGVVTTLKKGEAKITFTINGTKTVLPISVTTNPKLDKKTVTVKKNKVVKVKLTGKVKSIKNTYKNTKKAEIISKKNATKLKIKGLKKGTTTLKIRVNGVKTLKLKVNVI